jgi:non-heme chloroperoxidase
VPGWQDEAYLDAARTFFVAGQLGAPDALTHEDLLPCQQGAVVSRSALAKVRAPAYLYWGAADTTVPIASMRLWAQALPRVAQERVYPGEGHTVQYRHWDQILVDMAGLGRYTVMCVRHRTRLVPPAQVARLRHGGATLGICAWATARSTG